MVQSPTGTINRSVHDGLGRIVSAWVGTDDTGAFNGDPTGGGSPGNNMTQVAAYVYDNGGVGDGNLTETTQIVGLGAPDRVTQYFFDWRNRLIASKSGVEASEDSETHRPIHYTILDNLGQAVERLLFDGDGVDIVDADSDGVPDLPDASLLRARSTSEFDDHGRVFRTHVFSVDPADGTVSTHSLTTDFFFNLRGHTIAVFSPGGLARKMQYDGAGRMVVTDNCAARLSLFER